MNETATEKTGRERRVHDRWSLDGAARVIFTNHYDFSCSIKDMSASGLSVDTGLVPQIGDRAVIYVTGVGRLHAEVVRVRENDVALHFVIDNERQQAVVDRLERQVVAGIERNLQETIAALSDDEYQ
jgi:hypothetical protein